jgi:hypothetical protein
MGGGVGKKRSHLIPIGHGGQPTTFFQGRISTLWNSPAAA